MTKKRSYISVVIIIIAILAVLAVVFFCQKGTDKQEKEGNYRVVQHPTPNIGRGRNEVKGVVLHHTAVFSIEGPLEDLCKKKEKGNVSCHVMIGFDGTRYVLADPTQITWHAGYSMLNGREDCNKFTIGIEFQGNTAYAPLTDDQINSAIDYILPLMKKYKFKPENIVTHARIRENWLQAHPNSKVSRKVDITQKEYDRFMRVFIQRSSKK